MREGHSCEPGAKGVRFGHPRCESFRAVEREHATRARLGIAFIAKESFNASGFVQERKRSGQSGSQKVRQTGSVTTRLIGNGRKRGSLLFGLDNSHGLSIDKQQVIARPGFERDFPDDDAAPGGEVQRPVILKDPAGRGEHLVDSLPGLFLRSHLDYPIMHKPDGATRGFARLREVDG